MSKKIIVYAAVRHNTNDDTHFIDLSTMNLEEREVKYDVVAAKKGINELYPVVRITKFELSTDDPFVTGLNINWD